MRNILLAVLMLAAASWAQAPADTTAPAPVDTTTQIAEPVVEPVTPPAVVMGIANPRPTKVRCGVGFASAVTMPTT